MKKVALGLVLVGGMALAQEKPLDPCGSPKEVFSKYLLDKCYKGYFDSIVDAKKKADEALNKANALERIVQDHENRIRALEARPTTPAETPKKEEGVGPYHWQLEEVATVHFDFNKFDIKKKEAKKLDEAVDKIKSSGREVLVVGFADKVGTSKYNFNLSMWRAQMVASYLAKKGVDIGKIRMAAYGKEVADLLGIKHKEQRAVKVYIIK